MRDSRVEDAPKRAESPCASDGDCAKNVRIESDRAIHLTRSVRLTNVVGVVGLIDWRLRPASLLEHQGARGKVIYSTYEVRIEV